MKAQVSIEAGPNPIPFPEKLWHLAPIGTTRLTWNSEGTETVEVRVGAPHDRSVGR